MLWVLSDNRAGHRAQSIGLAQALAGDAFREVPLAYNALAGLPNALLGERLWHLQADTRHLIAPPWPAMVIAAGRRLVPVMRHIKRRSPETRLVQLMWPKRLAPFDYIIVPEHDRAPDDPRILRTLGALHPLSVALIEAEATRFRSQWAHLPRPWTAVLIGGRLRGADIARLADLSELLRDGGSLLITTSRRSPKDTAALLKSRLTCSYWLYDWNSTASNPYRALLGVADALVVSADSISMLSEACLTGRPVRIFAPGNALPVKHRQFAARLVTDGYAQWLSPDAAPDWQPAQALDESARVAEELIIRLRQNPEK